MKQIIFNLSDDFRIDLVTYAKTYELEFNTTEIIFKTSKVIDGARYELHKEQNGQKAFVLLEKVPDGLRYVCSDAFLAAAGNAALQIRAVSDDFAIESNIVDFRVGRFINATGEPTPAERGIVEELLAKVADLSAEVEELQNGVLFLE